MNDNNNMNDLNDINMKSNSKDCGKICTSKRIGKILFPSVYDLIDPNFPVVFLNTDSIFKLNSDTNPILSCITSNQYESQVTTITIAITIAIVISIAMITLKLIS